MAILKRQRINLIDMWSIIDNMSVSSHRDELESYACIDIDDMILYSLAKEIIKYRPDLTLDDGTIAIIMTKIYEYVNVEYRPF